MLGISALYSRRLNYLLRLVWIVVVLTSLVMVSISIFTLSAELRKPCDLANRPLECNSSVEEGLQELGISRKFYTNMQTAGVVVKVLPWFAAGGILFWKRPDDWFSVLISLSMVMGIIAIIDQDILSWAAWRIPGSAWIVRSIYIAGQFIGLILILFPNERKLSVPLVLFGFYLIASTIGGFFFPGTPLDINTWPDPLPLLYWSIIAVGFISIWTHRYRNSPLPEQQKIKWVVWAFAIFMAIHTLVRAAFTYASTGVDVVFLRMTLTPLQSLSSGLLAFAVLAAMLRYRLFDIDILIRRTLQYSFLTAVLGLLFYGGIVVLQSGAQALTGETDSPFITVVTTLGIAALFNPIRRRIQEFIDRRFFRQKYDAEQTLARFAVTARDEVELDNLAAAMLGAVEETLQPESVNLLLKPPKIRK